MRAGCFPWPRNQLAWRTAHPSTAVERPEAACATTTGISMGEQAGRIAIPRELSHTSFHKDTLPGGYDTEGPQHSDPRISRWGGRTTSVLRDHRHATSRNGASEAVPTEQVSSSDLDRRTCCRRRVSSSRNLPSQQAPCRIQPAAGPQPRCMFNPDDNGMGRAAVPSHLT